MKSAEAVSLALSIAGEDEAFAAALDESGEFAGSIEESGDIKVKSGDAEVTVPAGMIGGEPAEESADGDMPPEAAE